MYKHVDDYDSAQWNVIDAETSKPIRYVQWADDVKGEYAILAVDNNGTVLFGQEDVEVEIKKGNIKLVKKAI